MTGMFALSETICADPRTDMGRRRSGPGSAQGADGEEATIEAMLWKLDEAMLWKLGGRA